MLLVISETEKVEFQEFKKKKDNNLSAFVLSRFIVQLKMWVQPASNQFTLLNPLWLQHVTFIFWVTVTVIEVHFSKVIATVIKDIW